MSNQELEFLALRHWPARLNAGQTAAVLNCRLHDISILMAEGLLVPLGKPKQNAKKFFETKAILAAAQDRKWLVKVTEAISEAWRGRNGSDEAPEEPEASRLAA